MGACLSKDGEEAREQRRRNAEIERMLGREKRDSQPELKLLLLGAGESGKSTIAKQMRIIHLSGFTPRERSFFLRQIHSNIIAHIQLLLQQCAERSLDLLPANLEAAEALLEMPSSGRVAYDGAVAERVHACYNDPALQKVLSFASEFSLSDSAPYFLGDCVKYAEENYVPSDEDVLRVRAKTTGIVETAFVVKKTRFRMVDVGGQRNERKKWIHCFQDVTAVIYCAALNDFDLQLQEDPAVNRMHESLRLFSTLVNNKWFRDTGIILFLNKQDLFDRKMETGGDLRSCFPLYEGGSKPKTAREYIRKKFMEKNKFSGREVYPHFTIATDTENIKFVFAAVQKILLDSLLQLTMNI